MRNALVIYLGGVPASGKSSLFRGLRSVLFRGAAPFALRTCKGVEAGAFKMLGVFDGSTFEGTDKLSMSVIDDALAYIRDLNGRDGRSVVFVEGDRLLCDRFIREAACRVFIVDADERVLAQRRGARKVQGCSQTAQFWKAKRTKVNNIIAKWNPPVLKNNTTAEQASNLQRLVALARSWVAGGNAK